MAIHSPYLFGLKLVEYHGRLVCVWRWKEAFGESSSNKNYGLTLVVALIFIPFVVIAILYIIMFLKLKSQSRRSGEQSTNSGQRRQLRERKVLKMTIAVVLGLAVCLLPFIIGWLLSEFASDIWSCGFQRFVIVARFMIRANCAINPCICFIFSRNYREGLKTLLS